PRYRNKRFFAALRSEPAAPPILPRNPDHGEVGAVARDRRAARVQLDRMARGNRNGQRSTDAQVALLVVVLDVVDRGAAADVPDGVERSPHSARKTVDRVTLKIVDRILLALAVAEPVVVLGKECSARLHFENESAESLRQAE